MRSTRTWTTLGRRTSHVAGVRCEQRLLSMTLSVTRTGLARTYVDLFFIYVYMHTRTYARIEYIDFRASIF